MILDKLVAKARLLGTYNEITKLTPNSISVINSRGAYQIIKEGKDNRVYTLPYECIAIKKIDKLGIIKIVTSDKKVGLLDINADDLVKPIYEDIKVYNSQYIILNESNRQILINKDLEQLSSPGCTYINVYITNSSRIYAVMTNRDGITHTVSELIDDNAEIRVSNIISRGVKVYGEHFILYYNDKFDKFTLMDLGAGRDLDNSNWVKLNSGVIKIIRGIYKGIILEECKTPIIE